MSFHYRTMEGSGDNDGNTGHGNMKYVGRLKGRAWSPIGCMPTKCTSTSNHTSLQKAKAVEYKRGREITCKGSEK